MMCRQFDEDAWREIRGIPNYAVTPLRDLSRIAAAVNVDRILYKDEAGRFGLGSFKALGSVYAGIRAVRRQLQTLGRADLYAEHWQSASWRQIVANMTLVCASDGNHGRAVAWGANLMGCRCVVYLPARVGVARERPIAELGASTIRVQGNYDDAVRIARMDADRQGWIVVSDTSQDGTEPAAIDVMCGYMAIAREIVAQLEPEGEAPTHVFVQAGVGGLAAALCAYFWQTWGVERPHFIVVESDRADCLLRSAAAGRPTVVTGEHDTTMAGLACGEPSAVAWWILDPGADYFVSISDPAAMATMQLLNDGFACESIMPAPSGVAGLAAFLLCVGDHHARAALELEPSSRVLVIGTEGVADADLYSKMVSGRGDLEA